MIHKKLNRQYVLSTQGEFTGGFAKQPDIHPGTALLIILLMQCMKCVLVQIHYIVILGCVAYPLEEILPCNQFSHL